MVKKDFKFVVEVFKSFFEQEDIQRRLKAYRRKKNYGLGNMVTGRNCCISRKS